ncbi:MAG TPA: AI-2E family transporter [Candidatus Paceibacterota bacterium]
MHDESKPITVNISTVSVIKVLGIFVCVVVLFLVRDVALVLLMALVLASAIEPIVKRLTQSRLPRVVAVLSVYLAVVALVLVFTFVFVPPMLTEVSRIADTLPQYIETFNFPNIFSTKVNLVGGELINSGSIKDAIMQVQKALSGLSHGFFQTASLIFGGALSAMLILVISFYLAVEERGIENFLRVIIPIEREEYTIGLWKRAQGKIGLWLQGQMLLALVVGVLVYLGLTILQVPYATTLATLAALFEIIPIFGPIIAAVPAVIIGFSITPQLGLMVLGLYIIIQQFENHLIVPLVITKIVGIPPIIVIVALLVGSKLAGVLGFLLAIPLTTVIVELFSDFEKRKMHKAEKPA